MIHGDSAFAEYDDVVPVTEEDHADGVPRAGISAAVVPDVEGAIEHIRRLVVGHTEAIPSRATRADHRRFVAAVDSAAVMVNASTRFTDGDEFGFGAEIGISTQKLHARGPMGLLEADVEQVRRGRRGPRPVTCMPVG